MHAPGGVDDVERPEALFRTQPGKQLGRTTILQSERLEAMSEVELQHTRDHEPAQPAVGVVEKPGLLSRAAA
jgi:hypothetical protein